MVRGIGTVIGAVLLAIAVLAIAAFIYYALGLLTETQARLAEILGTKVSAATLASGVTGWWRQTGTTLQIRLENGLPAAIKTTSITILWSDGTYTVYDTHNTPTAALTATIRDEQGNIVHTGSPKLPIELGVAWTTDIYIDTGGKTTDKVYITLSSSPVVAVLPLKNYYELYPNTTTVINATTAASLATLYSLLDTAPGDNTKTWYGIVTAATPVKLYGSVIDYTVAAGTAVAGTASSLEATDGDTLDVDAEAKLLLANISVQDNLIYATDFEQGDVFASNEWGTIGGAWSWGPYGYGGTNGVQQSDTTTANGGIGGEYIAYPTSVSASTGTPYYVMSKIYTGNGYNDIVLFDSGTNQLYEYSIHPARGRMEIWVYSGGWDRLVSLYIDAQADTWYVSLVRYDPANRYHEFTVIDSYGNEATIALYDSTFLPTQLGVGTYASSASFDDFIASKGNPRYVNFTVLVDGSPAAGWTIELYNSAGSLVASATTGTDGLASLDVTWSPIIHGASIKVYNSTGDLVADVDLPAYGINTVYGGNLYTLDFRHLYTVDVETAASIDTGYVAAGGAYLLQANTTATALLMIYNWSTNGWSLVGAATLQASTPVSLEKLYSRDAGAAAGNGTVKLRVLAYADSPLRLSIDLMNAVYKVYNTTSFNGLVVAVGGTSLVEVYTVDSTGLVKALSLDAGTVFNGSATIAYNYVNGTLILVNTTGVYTAYIGPRAAWTIITTGCKASPAGGVEAEVVNASSHPYLVLLPGGGDQYCIIDLIDNTTVATGSLAAELGAEITIDPALAYPASAHPQGTPTAYFLAYNATGATPVIIKAVIAADGTPTWSLYQAAPGGHAAGLAASPTELWILLERGGLYLVTASRVEPVNGTLPVTPWGPGDRLEDYNTTHLLWIRADNTRETWLIKKG